MGEILGLTVTDFPNIRMKRHWMTGVLQGNIARGWEEKPHLKEIESWPKQMQEAWGKDVGEAAGSVAQAHQIEQFHKLQAALDDFNPDFIVIMYREGTDVFGDTARFQYNIQAHEGLRYKLFQPFTIGDNVFGEDPEREDTLLGHREGALHLVRALQERGLNSFYTLEQFTRTAPNPAQQPFISAHARHNLQSVAVHLDWDRREFKTPIVPIGFNPFGFCRTRNDAGLSPWDRSLPRPLLPKEAFELGRAIAQVYRASPWRVALVAGVDWSHMNDSGWELERLHPDVDADRKRYEQWKNHEFHKWGDNWTFDEMEEHAQWEMLVTITLAGAMSEVGAKLVHSDFQPHYVINDNFVTSIFEVK